MLWQLSYQAIGVFITGCLPVLRDALSIGAFYGVLGFTIAGFTYPNLAMLPAVQSYTLLYPLKYYYSLYCGIRINGLGFVDTWNIFLCLMAYIFLPLLIIIRLKKVAIKLNYSRD